ncbi:MAG TPA: hypothetical protein VM491_02585 [Burkholderiaceae bacterium]|jgi:hypothetical protein|nr:hypothetical protein [Burkholderiaceae bacterium]
MQRSDLAHRKSLLQSRAELDRLQLSLAVYDLQTQFQLRRSRPLSQAHPLARVLLGAAVTATVPLLGQGRVSRWLRLASIAMTAWRIGRDWRRGTRRASARPAEPQLTYGSSPPRE